MKSDARISDLHGLRWTLALGHGAVLEVWWGWVCLCIATGGGALVWWWRRGTVRPGSDRLREALPPVGLMLLGGLMLLLPVWRGLDRWLDDVDAALLWAFLSDEPAAVVPLSVPAASLPVCAAPVTDGLPGQCPAPCRVDGAVAAWMRAGRAGGEWAAGRLALACRPGLAAGVSAAPHPPAAPG